jgi:hypothetical protein
VLEKGRGSRGTVPVVVDCLDVEAESGAHGVDVFAHDFLDDGCFAGIVETAAAHIRLHQRKFIFQFRMLQTTYSIKMRSSLSLSLAFRRMDSIFSRGCGHLHESGIRAPYTSRKAKVEITTIPHEM